jgi:hypothetical protein
MDSRRDSNPTWAHFSAGGDGGARLAPEVRQGQPRHDGRSAPLAAGVLKVPYAAFIPTDQVAGRWAWKWNYRLWPTLPESNGDGSRPRRRPVLPERGESAKMHAKSGVIWGIPVQVKLSRYGAGTSGSRPLFV